ncbi:MAG: hypothetical protein J6D34_11555 [Atopobiaceae bacterium]|nr:hypothetical protein [Atopobiaceae bacterium]
MDEGQTDMLQTDEPQIGGTPRIEVLPQDSMSMREALGPWLPTATQVASALAMLALLSPAALGGMPVLPVTIEEDRRRRQDEIQQISESSVGIHHDAQEAQSSLTLSQRRLAQVTREVEHSHAHDVTEQDVVHAAHLVATGEATFGQQLRFRSALGRVANDSVDLFILSTDEAKERRLAEQELRDEDDEEDLDAWVEEFA